MESPRKDKLEFSRIEKFALRNFSTLQKSRQRMPAEAESLNLT
jgi:hypothetical protein